MTLLWPIVGNCLRNAHRPAIVDDRRTYTFGRILGGAFYLAEEIERRTEAQRIGLLLPTSGGVPVALLACWLAGRVPVPLNYLLTRDDIAFLIRDAGIDTLLTVQPMLDFLGGPDALPADVALLRLEDVDFTGVPPLRWPPFRPADQTAVLLYTSGTSARPKGVELTHANLLHNARACIRHARITRATGFLGVLPQFHSFGLTVLTVIPLLSGCRVTYSARFVPRRIVELIERDRPTIFVAVPSMYAALLSVKDARPEHLASIAMAISGGEALPQAVADQFHQRFGIRILEGYGLTETSPVVSWCTPWACRPLSVGPLLPGVEVVVVDEQDRPLPADQDGEVLIAGPGVMKGYYQRPEANRAAFIDLELPRPDGTRRRQRFFRSGDYGRLDAAGYLYITGRKKEAIKVAGEFVFPREVEEVLARHPAVREAAVIGRTDALRGEVPVAFVEINDDQAFDAADLRAFCARTLAQFKVPREIHRLDALPRTATGKILKRQLAPP